MVLKTNGFVKYSIMLLVIAAVLGGCKKDKPQEEPTKPVDGTSVQPDKPSVDNTETLKKIKAATAGINTKITEIARNSTGWETALAGYNGKTAPEMKIKDITGNPISVSGLKGKKTVIIKFTTLHDPSMKMLTTLAELQKQVGKDKLAVIGISTQDPAILKQTVEKMDIPFPVAGRPNRYTDPYRKIPDTPVCFFIDEAGKIQLITRKLIAPGDLDALYNAL